MLPQQETFSPKLHILEGHITHFLRKWKFPLRFFGEQGGESIHHDFKLIENINISVTPASTRLQKMPEQLFVVVNPNGRESVCQKGTSERHCHNFHFQMM